MRLVKHFMRVVLPTFKGVSPINQWLDLAINVPQLQGKWISQDPSDG